jgi:hypothetical protein
MANTSSELEEAMDIFSKMNTEKAPVKPKCSNCSSRYVCEPCNKIRKAVTKHGPIFEDNTLDDLMLILARQCKVFSPAQDDED